MTAGMDGNALRGTWNYAKMLIFHHPWVEQFQRIFTFLLTILYIAPFSTYVTFRHQFLFCFSKANYKHKGHIHEA